MSLTKETFEHEFLFRWNEAGHPQGCHIAYREAVLDDGVEIASRFLDPRPVALDDAPRLAEIGAAINAATLAALTTAQAEADAAKAALSKVEAERDAAIAERPAQPPAPEPNASSVPQVVSAFQAKAALMQAGLYDAINAALTSADAPPLAKLAWETARDFERGSPTVAGIGAQFGLDDAQLDALFIAASQIKA